MSRARLPSVLIAALLTLGLIAGPVAAEDAAAPPTLPDQPAQAICPQGQDHCIDDTIAEMQRRYRDLIAACDADAMFALLYLRTTETYRDVVREAPGYEPVDFEDQQWLNHYDAVFADAYFDARLAHDHRWGHLMPPAWEIAFEAAAEDAVTSVGSVLLGMNGHINRDLPFVLEDILDEAGNEVRHDDHTRVNEFLAQSRREATFNEIAARFDPTVWQQLERNVATGRFGNETLVPEWRERAWDNAQELLRAETPAERRGVARGIEQQAADIARDIVSDNRPWPALSGPDRTYGEMRDAHCEEARQG